MTQSENHPVDAVIFVLLLARAWQLTERYQLRRLGMSAWTRIVAPERLMSCECVISNNRVVWCGARRSWPRLIVTGVIDGAMTLVEDLIAVFIASINNTSVRLHDQASSYGGCVIDLKTPAEIEAMRPAGRFVASVLTALRDAADVGVNLLDLDALAHTMIRDVGAESCYIDYHPSFGANPFGKVLCTSVNDAVLHGLPHNYKLRDGDLLSVDFAVSLNDWVSDSALSVVVGNAREEDLRLIETTERALAAAIKHAVVGNKIGDISAAVADVSHVTRYSVNTQFGGHGVGRTMHGEPHVPNNGQAGRGLKLQPGLVIAIEPWLMETTDEIYTDKDGWTLRSADGSRGAHSEHTVAITADGPVVLTDRVCI